ncbi:carbon-nitrogen hydrolase [Microthyrium microscopicum]|uniref:Carbon-nitrogen hydrolase n=1 Tax=Microthyrium microscopicum TaxID=703497 RepID=A0A6A6U3B0_9PEZI|nr:carbon-nitrogen hydrolase [Microthyrium microscopicum]
MASILKVAVIQLHAEPMQMEKNFSQSESYIRSAAAQNAELAVLPEYHLTGWVPDDPAYFKLADEWETYLKKYQDLARELKICIVPGTMISRVQNDDGSDVLLNIAYFIGKSGEVLGSYRKKNLWHPERDHLVPGTQDHEAFDTPWGKVGLLICWDLAFPEAFRDLVTQGAKLIIIPTFWGLHDCSEQGAAYNPNAEALFIESTLVARAFENTCSIIFVNAGAPAGDSMIGLSQVTVPFIGPLAKFGSSLPGMILVDLDMNIAEHAEQHYKVRSDLARVDWHYGPNRRPTLP